MRAATKEMLGKAHLAMVKGTAIGTVTTPEWLATQLGCKVQDEAMPKNKAGQPDHLNYSQVWRYHTRQFVIGNGATCAHCTKELGGKVVTDLASIAGDLDRVRLAVVAAIAEGQSWGLISVRLGNNGVAQGEWPESKVRSTFREQAARHDRGLRPAHKGGRWIANRQDLYDDEVALGTKGDGYIRKPDEPLPPLGKAQVSEEVKVKRMADLKKRKAAHQATLNRLKAEYAKLIKG